MYRVSEAFKRAVYSRNTVIRPLIRFLNDSTFFTGDDIQLEGGLIVSEYLNTEEDLTVGCAPSSQLQVSVLNPKGYLNDYTYGECKIFLGAKVAETGWSRGDSTCTAIFGYGTDEAARFDAYSTLPYLKTNGVTSNAQPPEALQTILIYGNTFYGIMSSGDAWTAVWDGTKLIPAESETWDDLKTFTWDQISERRWIEFASVAELNDFMKYKLSRWKNRGLWYNSEVLYEFKDNRVEQYEYVPLGVFIVDTPTKKRTSTVALVAQDRMKRFDQDATSWWNGLQWPLTVKQLLTQLCTQVNVPLATTGDFINSTRIFTEAPLAANSLTYRDVLKWIAGGAGSYARFTRDGYLELTWFGTQSIDIPSNQYFPDYEISEYTVPKITGMQILNANNDIGVLLGNQGNVYQMVDNPVFYSSIEDTIRKLGAPVFLRLSSFATYAPLRARAVCNWAIQAGDIIKLDGLHLPIFNQTIVYNGGVRVTYQSTGGAAREVLSTQDRQVYQQKRAIHQLQVDIKGIQSHIEDTDGNIADLKLFAEGLTLNISNSQDGKSSTLTLKSGSATLSSGNISLSGLVSFSDLKAAGKTTINGSNITTGQINASLITTGSLSADRISGGTINADYIKVTNLDASSITSGSFGSSRISAGAITNSKIGDLEISGGKIDTNAIVNRHITSGSIAPSTCNSTINGYFADIIYANKIFAGSATASSIKTWVFTLNGKEAVWMNKANATQVLGRA